MRVNVLVSEQVLEVGFGVVYPVRVCVLTLLHVLEFVPKKVLGVTVAV